MSISRRKVLLFSLLAIAMVVGLLNGSWSSAADFIKRKVTNRSYTVSERLEMHGRSAREILSPYFSRAGVHYPPVKLLIVGLKAEKRLEIYAADDASIIRFVRSYPVLAASGEIGPKLKEGDGQVPEGIYRIESLNPNSQFHLSLRVNYPNQFDRERARLDRRTRLGGDIMIHGSRVSVGCLAMGDAVAEELFVLVADTGLANVEVILSPVDFRNREVSPSELKEFPGWVLDLYQDIKVRLLKLERREI